MSGKKSPIFKFKPFSKKQRMVLNWWCETSPVRSADGIIADGAIRSGKTICMSLSFVFWAMETFNDQNFGMCGKTIGSFRRNVLFWLKRMLKSRGYTVMDHRADNLITVSRGSVENHFYVFGGKDERSQDLIQGITLAGIFFDEVALMPESFVNQATGRCSVEGSKFWFNCNPEGPEHWFKLHWIDKSAGYMGKEESAKAAESALKNILYLHFTMHDNLSLASEIIKRYMSMYTGVFYDRFILGLWVLASGIIFRRFAENDEPYLYEDADLLDDKGRLRNQFSKITIGIDFGGNNSMTTFVATGFLERYHNLYALEEDNLPVKEEIDADKICEAFIRFYRGIIEKYGDVDWVFPDSASPTMINSLRSASKKVGLPYRNIKSCRKNEITERPKTVDLLLNTGRLKINRRCVLLRKAIASMRWDEDKPDVPEDKNIGNCNDWWDAFCYSWLDFVDFIDLDR